MKIPLILIMALWSVGCTHHDTPNVFPVFDPITEFTSTNAVHLVNGQPSTTETQFFAQGIHRHVGNFNRWTDVAIELASRELKKRKMNVVGQAPKTLTLAVKGANIDIGWVRIDTHIYLTATTSTGQSETYDGFDFAVMMGNPQGQLDTAMMKAVAAMLNDPKIVAFLRD